MPFTIERNDLAAMGVDAVVVAANEQLQITGGVGLVVAQAAGLERLQAACDAIGFCPCGSAVATPGFNLRARTVVHAVGPVWRGGQHGEADFLRSAYDAALECAAAEGARSVALPLISAGTYGFPADVSLAVAREGVRAFLNRRDDIDVRLVLYSRESVTAGMAAYLQIAEYVDDNYVDGHPALGTAVLRPMSVPDMPPRPFPQQAPTTRPLAQSAPASAQPAASRKKRRGIITRLGEAIEDARDRHAESDAVPDQGAPLFSAPAADETASMPPLAAAPMAAASLEDLLDSLDAPFSTTLLALIDERGMTDAQVYKRANMSRQLFSKIRSDASYRPTKKTVLALSVALGLNLPETRDLLARAGFALSHSSKSDVIVEYFIAQGNHDIFQINEALYAFDQPIL